MPIIALTAHAMTGDEAEVPSGRVLRAFVTKPIEIDLLLSTVAEALEDRRRRSGPIGIASRPRPLPRLRLPLPSAAARYRGAPTTRAAGRFVSTLPMDDPEFREIVDEFVVRLVAQLKAMRQAPRRRTGTSWAAWLIG